MDKKKFQLKARILYNKKIKGVFWHCSFRAPELSARVMPGQFVNVRLTEGYQPLLRRPFSVHDAGEGKFTVMYQVVGEGTALFSRQKPGKELDIIGPLGNGFSLSFLSQGSYTILVAGGMGVAPLLFLAKRIATKPLVLIGAKTKTQILCEKDFIDAGCSVKIATDDGSRGFKGYVSGLLEKELSAIARRAPVIYACGPRPMLKEVSGVANRQMIPAQLSLEEHMACGIGACLGCVVSTRSGFKRVCKEGPVFAADELMW